MLDAGLPDGVNGSLVYRLFRPLQIHAGGGTNLISMGVRAGAQLYLLPTVVSPSLSVEAGHYFAANANAFANRLGVTSDSDNPLLRDFGYDYANLHLGLDLGRDRYSFYVHAGLSAIRAKLHNFGESVSDDARDGISVEVRQDPTATFIVPSARMGFLFFF